MIVNSKFKTPAGLSGHPARPQITANGLDHKQAVSSLGPFADLLLHATNLLHRCKCNTARSKVNHIGC